MSDVVRIITGVVRQKGVNTRQKMRHIYRSTDMMEFPEEREREREGERRKIQIHGGAF